MSSRMGALSAIVIPAYFVTNEATRQADKAHMYYMYLTLSILCTLTFVFSFIGKLISSNKFC